MELYIGMLQSSFLDAVFFTCSWQISWYHAAHDAGEFL